MEYLVYLLVLISSALLFMIIIRGSFWRSGKMQARISKINQLYEENIEVEDRRQLPFKTRIIEPIFEKIRALVRRATPEGIRFSVGQKLSLADYPYGLTIAGWLGLRFAFSYILPLVFAIFIWIGSFPILVKILWIAIFALICNIFPNVVLNSRISIRKNKISMELPDVLDLLTVSVEAGLGFDGALSKVVEKKRGPLSAEFSKVLNEIQLGKTRREALRSMSNRCQVDDVTVFISSIIQAEKMGVSIGKVLRVQSEQMRIKRRQRAQEQAMKAPVKMLLPMVLFIFPSIFVVILGPAFIQIKNSLFGVL